MTWRPSPTHHSLRERLAVTRAAQIGDVLGNDTEIESVSSEGDKVVDAAADLEIEEMGLLLA